MHTTKRERRRRSLRARRSGRRPCSGVALLALGVLVGCKRIEPVAVSVPYSADFSEKTLGPEWMPSGGHWAIEDGRLISTGAHNAPLFLRAVLPENVVVEFDSYSETHDVDTKVELMTDGKKHASGYIFVLGGWKNKHSVIARLDEHGRDRKTKTPTQVTGKRWIHWRIEKHERHIRWLLDKKPYLEFEDPEPLHGPHHNRFAFNNWRNQLRFDNLVIRPYPQSEPIATSTPADTQKELSHD